MSSSRGASSRMQPVCWRICWTSSSPSAPSWKKEEMNGNHAFDRLMQDLTRLDDLKDTSEGDLRDTSDTRDADQKCVDDLVTACERNASDCESRQQLRTEEI
jgi:hypothetical protein